MRGRAETACKSNLSNLVAAPGYGLPINVIQNVTGEHREKFNTNYNTADSGPL